MFAKNQSLTFFSLVVAALMMTTTFSFHVQSSVKVQTSISGNRRWQPSTRLWEEKTDGVVELVDDDEKTVTKAVAPFMSQGEISEEGMEMDLSDPKQARVMFYIILSLLPVLFLIPLMLGSREMIPAEMLPPVELN